MTVDTVRMIEAARAVAGEFKLRENFSAGSVGAAVLTESGNIYSGICIDLACGLGFCAEVAALAEMLKARGGIRDESADAGRAAYKALSMGGGSGFNALLAGGRDPDGTEYRRLDAHGFYWTASETGPGTAWFYNFGKGQLSLGRHHDGEKQRAFSVRCVRDW